jgi:hypothetical protein
MSNLAGKSEKFPFSNELKEKSSNQTILMAGSSILFSQLPVNRPNF